MKYIDELAKDNQKKLVKFLTKHKSTVELTYQITIPENLAKMNGEEFLNYILSIQNLVYKAVNEMGYQTPLYYQINEFLFTSHKAVCIGVANEYSKEDEMFICG